MEDKVFLKNYQLEFVELDEEDEAFAAISMNKQFNHLKFILTDDKPNANKQRIPKEEFQNLIITGIHTPFKMASKRIRDGHEEAIPLGVITHLKEVEDKIIGIAALWAKERPEDIEIVKNAYSQKLPLNVSWEVGYLDSILEDGIEILKGTSLRASTLVGLPAYEGRTPVLALASKDNEEEITLEELETLKVQHEELKGKFDAAVAEVEALKATTPELEELREYKASVEKEKADATKLAEIKEKFSAAGIEKDEEYFATNKALLLGLDAAALDFMIQELVSFSSKTEDKSTSSSRIPKLTGTHTLDLSDPKALGRELRERLSRTS